MAYLHETMNKKQFCGGINKLGVMNKITRTLSSVGHPIKKLSSNSKTLESRK